MCDDDHHTSVVLIPCWVQDLFKVRKNIAKALLEKSTIKHIKASFNEGNTRRGDLLIRDFKF